MNAALRVVRADERLNVVETGLLTGIASAVAIGSGPDRRVARRLALQGQRLAFIMSLMAQRAGLLT